MGCSPAEIPAQERRDIAIEWALGLGIPILVAGPLCASVSPDLSLPVLTHHPDYVNQSARFQILEGFGCTNVTDRSILEVLLVRSWSIVPPLLSVIIYYSTRWPCSFHIPSHYGMHFSKDGKNILSTNQGYRLLSTRNGLYVAQAIPPRSCPSEP